MILVIPNFSSVSYIEGKIWWKLIRPNLKERITSEINPAQIPKKSSTVDLRHFLKDLNKSVPRVPKRQERSLDKLKEYLAIRNGVKWARRFIITSRSSFPPMEKKKRIPRGYCRGDRPGNPYQCVCLAKGLVQGRTPLWLGKAKDKG